MEAGMTSKLDLPPSFDLATVDGKLLKKGLDQEDPLSMEIILDSARYVGIGIYNIFQALNPPLVVLGGGLMSWGDFYLNQIKRTFYKYAGNMIFDPFDIVASQIGPDVGVIGAASLALEL
jgi:predicted NBD/HSP70 family sugar kinase